ncbi:hypothetical protein JEQ12_004152 [Ovis aries]|uniref:NADH dehydrogenase [ubiquinone] 1 beta subcomplex subunit 1 n=1 Tax=Ovis aries TaxID=9940 RepID=A0A836CXM3_SHEEP|nr:hypothetical protein JEQ12_004152 [Ovis aries]
MTNLLQVVCDHWVRLFVPVRFVFGCYLDRKNDGKLTAFCSKKVTWK